jgi:hypothetical protein
MDDFASSFYTKIQSYRSGTSILFKLSRNVAAAERGKIRINELRDDLVGDLRIATTPEFGALHVIPALSHWMSAQSTCNPF